MQTEKHQLIELLNKLFDLKIELSADEDKLKKTYEKLSAVDLLYLYNEVCKQSIRSHSVLQEDPAQYRKLMSYDGMIQLISTIS